MIIFASMKGCGHCEKAKEHLADEIAQGSVKVVDATEAKKHGMDGNGFPQFKSNVFVSDANISIFPHDAKMYV